MQQNLERIKYLIEKDDYKALFNIEFQRKRELERIEKFLRGEVIDLRNEISQLRTSTEYRMGLFFKKILLLDKLIKIKKVITLKLNRKRAAVEIEDKNQDSQVNSLIKVISENEIQTLFIQLSNNKEIGGISQLNSIFTSAIEKNKRVFTLNLSYDFSARDGDTKNLIPKDTIERYKVNKVVFSGIESYEFILSQKNLNSAKKINFLQGPDYLFPGNETKLSQFRESLENVDLVIAQSPYLNNIAKFFNSKNSVNITLGPKETIFYDKHISKDKILVIATRKDADKGLRFALPVFKIVRKNGWSIIGFGDLLAPELAAEFDEHYGRIDQIEVAEILQNASLLLDLSIYEGLGLTVLEAGMCGVRSVITRKGGIESLESLRNELIFIDDPRDLDEIVQKILKFEYPLPTAERKKLVANSSNYAWENAIDKIIEEIENV